MTREDCMRLARANTLAETRRAVVRAYTAAHKTCSQETENHYRTAFLAIPETTEAMWAEQLHEARRRYWRLTHDATGAVREVEAYTLDGALTAAGWPLADCRQVEGPRGRSFAEMDAVAAACGAALADAECGYLAEVRLELGDECGHADRNTDTDGLPYGYGRG